MDSSPTLPMLLACLVLLCATALAGNAQTAGDAPLVRAAARAASELKAARALIAALEKQRGQLEDRLNTDTAQIAALNNSLAASRANAADLTRRLAAVEERHKAAEASLTRVRADLTQAQARIAELESELNRMRIQAQTPQPAPAQVKTSTAHKKGSRTWIWVAAIAGGVALIVALAVN